MADGIVVRILGDDSDLARTLDDSIKSVAKWSAAAAAAAAAAGVAITKSTASSAREIKQLSNLVAASTTEFQRMAAGAKTLGIEQDKLADIYKDTNDKLGDFLQTGAGPLADFFDNIAPKIGLTADEFKNLSGPQALQKYASGLEQANVSQAEMTFFMEAIASDASLLTPLLKENGKGFEEIADQAEKAGAILSEIDIAKLEQLSVKVVEGEQAFAGLTNKIALELSPQITGLIEEFQSLGANSEELETIINESFNGIVNAIGFAGNSVRGLEVIFQTLQAGAAQSMTGLLDIVGLFNDEFKTEAENMRQTAEGLWDKVDETLNQPLPSDALKAWVEQNRVAAEEAAKITQEQNELNNENALVQVETELLIQQEKFARLLEMEKEYQEASKEGLDAFNENNLRSVDEYLRANEALESASAKRRLNLASSAFGNLSTLMDTENKKLFQIGKVAALSQAVIDGYSAVLSSYKEGAKIGGPVVGAAFAATAGIATAVQISKISSASYGGGGGGVSGAVSGGQPNVPETQQASQGQESVPQQSVVLSGLDPNSIFSGEQVMGLIDNINGALEDGAVLRVS